jgi:CRISPR-associated protein Csd2
MTENQPHLDPHVRQDALLLIEVVDSNPNGDPDAANQPRTDPETGQGLMTDVSLKRKVRDTVDLVRDTLPDPDRYRIYITAGKALNTVHDEAYADVEKATLVKADSDTAQQWLREHYFDIRMFGAVMTTGKNTAGRVTGPVQFGMARSIDPIVPTELAITRVTKTVAGNEDQSEMGSKWIVPYGLYAARVHYSAPQGQATGVTSGDLGVLWSSLGTMWDHTRSAARTNITTRGLYIFSHSSSLGDAPASSLIETITIRKTSETPPRSLADYDILVPNPTALPHGVQLTCL